MFGNSLVFAAVLCLVAGLAPAAENTVPREGTDAISVPQLINYQGKLTDAGGNPLTGNYNMKFEIFDDELAGATYWNETQNNVPVASGLFNVIMGSQTPISNLPDGPECWLEITVAGEKITPRVRLAAVPYTYKAGKAEDANKLGGVAAASYATQAWVTGQGYTTQAWVNSQNFERQANKDVANGYCGLDASAKVTLPKLAQGGATPGQVLGWSGGQWAPVAAGGTGTVTSISQGTGMSFSVTPITTTGTINLAVPVVVANGGTGATALTGVVIGSGTNAFTALNPLTVAYGGTGRTALTANYLLYGNGTSAVNLLAPGTGYLYCSGGAPSWQAVSGFLTGSGTANYSARWTSASDLAQGSIQDGGAGYIGVGASPNVSYSVYGYNTGAGYTGVYGSASAGYGVVGNSRNFTNPCYGVLGYYAGSLVVPYAGVYGYNSYLHSAYYGVYGYSLANGVAGYNGTNATYGVLGTTYGVSAGVYGNGGTTYYGVYGYGATGVCGMYSATHYGYLGGVSYGVYGTTSSTTLGTTAVYGFTNSGGFGYAVYGYDGATGYAVGILAPQYTAAGSQYIGVYGIARSATQGYGVYGTGGTGVCGVTTLAAGYGVYGSNSAGYGVYGYSGSASYAGGYFRQGTNWTAIGIPTYKVIGSGSASTVIDAGIPGKVRVLHCPETPEVYFEDVGSARLAGGYARVDIDPLLLDNIVIDREHPLRVFVQLTSGSAVPTVITKGATYFEVRVADGASNASFDWRICANRKGYEHLRFELFNLPSEQPGQPRRNPDGSGL